MSLLPFMIPDIAEAGCDEAGRGCLCGPVSCAAVILPADFKDPGLNDSKQLDAAERQRLRAIIEEILPSHVDITYVFWYNTWGMVAQRHPTWGDAAAAGLSWYGVATENDGFGDES